MIEQGAADSGDAHGFGKSVKLLLAGRLRVHRQGLPGIPA